MAGCSKKQYAIMMGSGPEGEKLAARMGAMEQEEFNQAFKELLESDAATETVARAEESGETPSKWSADDDEDYGEFDPDMDDDYGFDEIEQKVYTMPSDNLTDEDLEELKSRGIEIVGNKDGNVSLKGSESDLKDFFENHVGVEMDKDWLVNEEDFDTETYGDEEVSEKDFTGYRGDEHYQDGGKIRHDEEPINYSSKASALAEQYELDWKNNRQGIYEKVRNEYGIDVADEMSDILDDEDEVTDDEISEHLADYQWQITDKTTAGQYAQECADRMGISKERVFNIIKQQAPEQIKEDSNMWKIVNAWENDEEYFDNVENHEEEHGSHLYFGGVDEETLRKSEDFKIKEYLKELDEYRKIDDPKKEFYERGAKEIENDINARLKQIKSVPNDIGKVTEQKVGDDIRKNKIDMDYGQLDELAEIIMASDNPKVELQNAIMALKGASGKSIQKWIESKKGK